MSCSLCRDESSWDIWTVCYRMPCSLSVEHESSCRHLNCLLQDAMLSLCRDESSWDIWTVCYRMPCSLSIEMSHQRHLNCLLQDAVLYLRESMSHPIDIWTVCYRMPCLSAETSHPETFELFVTGCHALSLQRWVILRHLNCLLQDAMHLCRDEHGIL